MITEILVPDIGDFTDVEVIEVLVTVGDQIKAEDSLITLESDKATMEVPAPSSGTVKAIKVNVGDQVSEGTLIVILEAAETVDAEARPAETKQAIEKEPPASPSFEKVSESEKKPPLSSSAEISEIHKEPPPVPPFPQPPIPPRPLDEEVGLSDVHASPSVRRFARELGADLRKMTGSGRKGRVLKEDVQAYVKGELARPPATTKASGSGITEVPAIDFSQFGEIEQQPLSRIKKVSGPNLQRSWLNAPHVTQFDEADITSLEAYRKSLKAEGEKRGVKVTMLSFLMKASVSALKKFPDFNSSLAPDRAHLILKKYYHLGIAVDTPEGLVVPVIRDVDRKGLFELAEELGTISAKARERKLTPTDMQGASFTISSLGGIGGTAFTPIVNVPEVAILGVSRSSMKPVYQNEEFVPRLMLPLSLSYDHRVIDGAAGARFTRFLAEILSDERNLLL